MFLRTQSSYTVLMIVVHVPDQYGEMVKGNRGESADDKPLISIFIIIFIFYIPVVTDKHIRCEFEAFNDDDREAYLESTAVHSTAANVRIDYNISSADIHIQLSVRDSNNSVVSKHLLQSDKSYFEFDSSNISRPYFIALHVIRICTVYCDTDEYVEIRDVRLESSPLNGLCSL